jgi:major vault protein
VRLRHSDQEIRFESLDPFPLYPGESLVGKVTPLQVVAPNTAIRLRAIRDFKEFKAGDEWLFKGPGTYHPSVEVQVVEIVKAIIIKPNQAVRLKARKDFVDSEGNHRKAGEEWLIRIEGAYLPDVHEEVRETISAYVLTEKKALHLTAITTFTDIFKVLRKAGEQWLVTIQDAETHIPDVYERVIGEVPITTLTSPQYCVVVDPVEQGRNQLGKRELRKGEVSFFPSA